MLLSLRLQASVGNESDSLLTVLDKVMEEQASYTLVKEKRIDALKSALKTTETPEARYALIEDLISEYKNYRLDSTLKYVEDNLQITAKLKNPGLTIAANFNAIYLLGMSGRYIDALSHLEKLDKTAITRKNVVEYYTICYNLYDRLKTESYSSELKKHYSELSIKYRDSLMASIPEQSMQYLALEELAFIHNAKLEESLEINTLRINKSSPSNVDYALISFYRAQIFSKMGEMEMAKKFYSLSAIADIKNTNKNSASLLELSQLLYREKKLKSASKYINFAMKEAIFYNSKYRSFYLSSVLPLINDAYQTEISKQNHHLKVYSYTVTALTTLFLAAIAYIYLQLKRLTEARNALKTTNERLHTLNRQLNNSNDRLNNTILQLQEANHVKEEYIGNFLRICSNYIDKLNLYRKKVKNDITNKRVGELLEFSKSNAFIESEIAEFYRYFDSAFLSIYPDFVKEFNDLLHTEEHIEPKKGELLTTELRIFALIRLGINDSSKIAELLRYSVNTIYNYRAKVKNKAKNNRELFEAHVLTIGTHVN